MPSLRAMGARCWGGVPPLPSPPLWPLVLGVRDCSGEGISFDASSVVSVSARALLGVSSPPSSLCAFPLAGAGPTLTVPPSDAARSAPMVCAVGCPAPLSLSSWIGKGPAVTVPSTAAAAAAPMGCAFGRPAPPACFSVSVSASASAISVAPCGAAPSPPSVGYSLLGRVVGGFSSPPPCPRPLSPLRDQEAVGDPRVLTPSGPQTSLGVDSSLDDSTPPSVCIWSQVILP